MVWGQRCKNGQLACNADHPCHECSEGRKKIAAPNGANITCSVAGDDHYKFFSPGRGWVIIHTETGNIVWTHGEAPREVAIKAAKFDGFEFTTLTVRNGLVVEDHS